MNWLQCGDTCMNTDGLHYVKRSVARDFREENERVVYIAVYRDNAPNITIDEADAAPLLEWLEGQKAQPVVVNDLPSGFPELTQEQVAEIAAALATFKTTGAWELVRNDIEVVPAPRPEDDSHERYILRLFNELESAALLGESIYDWMRRADAALMRVLKKDQS